MSDDLFEQARERVRDAVVEMYQLRDESTCPCGEDHPPDMVKSVLVLVQGTTLTPEGEHISSSSSLSIDASFIDEVGMLQTQLWIRQGRAAGVDE